MKRLLLIGLLFFLFLAISNNSSARITYAGQPTIIWRGDPMTSTSGTLYCSGSIMYVCCIREGNSLWINTGGVGLWATCSPVAPDEHITGDLAESEHEFDDAQR